MTVVLSRFACLRREGRHLVVDGPRGSVAYDDEAACALVVALFETGATTNGAGTGTAGGAAAEELEARLVQIGALVEPAEADAERREPWSVPERIVHERMRSWRPGPPSDLPPPAIVESCWEPAIQLAHPDVDRLEAEDPPFAAVHARRASSRAFAPGGLDADRLAEFLFRVGRIEDLWHGAGHDMAARPYPSAGGLYELELFPVVGDCSGVPPGLYFYAADHHRLDLVCPANFATAAMMAAGAGAMGVSELPPVLLIVSGRIGRLSWKYGSLSHTLMLKDAGVLLGVMDLAAAAMGLGGCALGTVLGDMFQRATRLGPADQAAVAGFCIGQPASPSMA